MEGLGLGAKAPLRLSTEDEKFDAQISVFFENQNFIRRDSCCVLVIMSIQCTLNPEHTPSFCAVGTSLSRRYQFYLR